MKKDELIKWFNNKFNSCYYVVHENYPNSIYMYYDPQIVRQIKLAKISNTKVNITKIKGICIFEQDWKNKILYCKYSDIWSFLETHYSPKYDDIKSFISDRVIRGRQNVCTDTHPGPVPERGIVIRGRQNGCTDTNPFILV